MATPMMLCMHLLAQSALDLNCSAAISTQPVRRPGKNTFFLNSTVTFVIISLKNGWQQHMVAAVCSAQQQGRLMLSWGWTDEAIIWSNKFTLFACETICLADMKVLWAKPASVWRCLVLFLSMKYMGAWLQGTWIYSFLVLLWLQLTKLGWNSITAELFQLHWKKQTPELEVNEMMWLFICSSDFLSIAGCWKRTEYFPAFQNAHFNYIFIHLYSASTETQNGLQHSLLFHFILPTTLWYSLGWEYANGTTPPRPFSL